ncbi:hypothetical protein PCASD_20626 [Puccinia coronata f. sp. avenae]|uniref:Tet-like 2OG-Fe(II) oxygenase domain-containing protein n=1 Tax=Puccinia coronata f. sp. avenae TaxID=200324 RepID=A0A2N5U1A7_9BASI|nr:hypothetical protein PCASD_20626 [Puccinia coronata f. sp. avenae]
MASHRSNLTNKDKISGRISGIGFCGGYEKGKTAGTYAIQRNLKPAQVALDRCLQTKLPDLNKFISDCIRHFSHEASKTNAKALKEFGMPSWSDKQWEDLKKYNPQPIASSVIVTSNDFSNSAHFNKDKNLFTYRIFSYINKFTGTPILPPSHTLGHAICFPDYDCNINFGGIPGIIEVLWKSNDITHHTIGAAEAGQGGFLLDQPVQVPACQGGMISAGLVQSVLPAEENFPLAGEMYLHQPVKDKSTSARQHRLYLAALEGTLIDRRYRLYRPTKEQCSSSDW